MTAALQAQFTVKQAARLMNISERMVYMARELVATGREDLLEQVEAGKLSTLGALKLAKPEKYDKPKDRFTALVRAFNACDDDERDRFVFEILRAITKQSI
jgi:hypothetical protein